LTALQWPDIDFHGKFLIVRRNYSHGRLKMPKNGKTRRVDLSDTLLTALEQLKRKRKECWLTQGQNEIPLWVFANSKGNLHDMQNIKNYYFFKCLERAGLRRIRFHDLRHTFASLLIQNGESLSYVKEQMGHSSIKVTVDIYGHLVPGANRQAVNRLPSLHTATKLNSQAGSK
jgi:integrase